MDPTERSIRTHPTCTVMKIPIRRNSRFCPGLSAFVVALITVSAFMAPVSLRAQQTPAAANTSIRTALQHSALAVNATELPQVRQHLKHVLNCLEGKQGAQYDASGGDPCKGRGALDATPAGSANRVRITKAISLLTVGVTFQDYKPAHYVAQAVQAVLQEIGS
jgi:hypothetical protein